MPQIDVSEERYKIDVNEERYKKDVNEERYTSTRRARCR